MSEDPETARQIAELARDTRPLVVLDVDEVESRGTDSQSPTPTIGESAPSIVIPEGEPSEPIRDLLAR